MKLYLKALSLFERELEQLKLFSATDLEMAEKGIQLCRDALTKTRMRVLKKGFKNPQEECLFFKTIKPKLVGYLIFYRNVVYVSLYKPKGSEKDCIKFYREYSSSLGNYFFEHREIYQYYIRKHSHLDLAYFTRNTPATVSNCDSITPLIDAQFATAKDMVFAQIIGNLMTLDYLKNRKTSKERKFLTATKLKSTLKWTGAKVDLVELIYALHASTMINNGNVEIKEVASAMEQLFGIEVGDYYRIFLEIRERKKRPTKLLDTLKTSLLNRMIEADG